MTLGKLVVPSGSCSGNPTLQMLPLQPPCWSRLCPLWSTGQAPDPTVLFKIYRDPLVTVASTTRGVVLAETAPGVAAACSSPPSWEGNTQLPASCG